MFSSRTVSVAVLALLVTSGVSYGLAAQAAPGASVTISSPPAGEVFNRGEVATITASVASGGSPASGATVTATTPTGGQLSLTETSTAGTYSGQYVVQSSDPLGTWTITVQAVIGQQVASATATASVSGSLLVSFASPAPGSLFNVGETATVKATVTYHDGTAISSAGTVSFVSPAGASVAMSVDPADATGKTWSGTYTVLPSDVPADGATWAMTASASYSGNTGSAVQTAALFKSLVVGLSTYGSSSYGTPQANFQAGQTVYVKGTAALHDGTPVTSGNAFFTITGTTVFSTSMPMTYSLTAGAWTGEYTVLPTDQTGAQTVTVTAADGKGNAGSASQQITIGVQGLSVSITSPSAGAVLNRGQAATIDASVSADGVPASSATVTANSPSGSAVFLANLGSGAYTARYTVFSTDPTGVWVIDVHASESGLTGSAQVGVTVSNQLKVAVTTWGSSSFDTPQSSFNPGQAVYVKAQVALQDGTPVTSGSLSFAISGTGSATSPVAMTYDSSLGAWVGSYTLVQGDQTGAQTVTVTAADGSGNSGSGTHSVSIAGAPPSSGQPLEAQVTLDPATHAIRVIAVCDTGAGCVGPTTVTNSSSPSHPGHPDRGAAPSDPGKGHGPGHDDKGKHGTTLFTFTITDSAGHSLVLNLSLNAHGNQPKATILGFSYGGSAPIKPSHNSIAFELPPGPPAGLVTVNERAEAGGATYNAHYDGHRGVTTITTAGSTATKSGLWLLELATSNGALEVTAVPGQATPPITPSTSITTLSCALPHQGPGGQVELKCTATVVGVDPSGAVTWTSSSSTGTFSSITCTLTGGPGPRGGHCEVTYAQASSGTVTIAASYSGDQNNLASSASVTLVIA